MEISHDARADATRWKISTVRYCTIYPKFSIFNGSLRVLCGHIHRRRTKVTNLVLWVEKLNRTLNMMIDSDSKIQRKQVWRLLYRLLPMCGRLSAHLFRPLKWKENLRKRRVLWAQWFWCWIVWNEMFWKDVPAAVSTSSSFSFACLLSLINWWIQNCQSSVFYHIEYYRWKSDDPSLVGAGARTSSCSDRSDTTYRYLLHSTWADSHNPCWMCGKQRSLIPLELKVVSTARSNHWLHKSNIHTSTAHYLIKQLS